MNRLESIATAALGAAVAGISGTPLGLTVPAAIVGAANGAIAGATGIYDWPNWRGRLAFLLDSSWALPTTTAALGSHLIAQVRGRPGWIRGLSERQNRHVYARGFQPRAHFLITIGNVVSGVGGDVGERRTRLVTDHENVHVWQARWFGPLFPILYGGWMITGGTYGGLRWLTGSRAKSFPSTVEAYAYYLNPFEWWAYSRDASWPPSAIRGHFGPQRPIVRPFSSPNAD